MVHALTCAEICTRWSGAGTKKYSAASSAPSLRYSTSRSPRYLFVTGLEIERGEFKRMTGLGDRTAVNLVSALVRRGLLRSDTVQGKVRFGLPLHALRFYFPALWPEAEADTAAM